MAALVLVLRSLSLSLSLAASLHCCCAASAEVGCIFLSLGGVCSYSSCRRCSDSLALACPSHRKAGPNSAAKAQITWTDLSFAGQIAQRGVTNRKSLENRKLCPKTRGSERKIMVKNHSPAQKVFWEIVPNRSAEAAQRTHCEVTIRGVNSGVRSRRRVSL